MAKLRKKRAAEEELKIKKTSVEEKPETEVEEEVSEEEMKTETEVEEEVSEEEMEEGEKITLDSGAVVDETAHPDSEEAEKLVTITKEDGTEIYVEKVETDSEEEKKDIYEAIVEADSKDAADEASSEVLEELDEEEVDEVAYIPAACKTHAASLNNSFYIIKTKAGKIKAFKAGKILDIKTKASLLTKIKAGKKIESPESVFSRVARKIGTKLSAFAKLASQRAGIPVIGDTVVDPKSGKEIKIIASKKVKNDVMLVLNNGEVIPAKKLVAAETTTDDSKKLETFSVNTKDLEKSDYESSMNIDEKALEDKDAVKPAKSKIKEFYGRLPNKAQTGVDVDWYLKDFAKVRNKTVASQVKTLRDITKALHEAKEVVASKDETIKSLQAKLDLIENQKRVMLKNNKINKITASMQLSDPEEIRCVTKKLASYSDEQLDAVYETINLSPDLLTNLTHEQEANELMKKEASADAYVPGMFLTEDMGSHKSLDYAELLKQKEIEKYNK